MPTWLLTPGPVILKCHVRTSKNDPLVDEVQLLQANPQYAHIRHTDGRETTVSIQHLAPSGSSSGGTNVLPWHDPQAETVSQSDRATVVEGAIDHLEHPAEDTITNTTMEGDIQVPVAPERLTTPTPTLPMNSTGPAVSGDMATPTKHAPLLRRSSRQRRAPDRLSYPLKAEGK